MNDKTLNTVVLAGLLHDVGKLEQRVKKDLGVRHEIKSKEFVMNVLFTVWPVADKFIDKDLLILLVENHHEASIARIKKSETPEKTSLMYLLSEADNTSAKERGEDSKFSEREFQLYSVFDILAESEDSNPYPAQAVFYPGYWEKALSVDRDVFLKPLKELFRRNDGELDFGKVYNSLYEFLLKYAYLVPDFTLSEYPRTSLFTHSVFTSAIAGCLYLYHKENDNLREKDIKNDEIEKFIVYTGALSPVQEFLFSIEGENPKHIAKILRGRSALLSWTAEAIAYDILSEFSLPVSNLISKQGVKFTLLLPNTENAQKVLAEKEAGIIDFLAERFSMRLNYASAGVKLCQRDFKKKPEEPGGKGREAEVDSGLRDKFQELSKTLARNKFCGEIPGNLDGILKRKYDSLLSMVSKDKNSIFCAFCGSEFAGVGGLCEFCRMAEEAGEKLAKRYKILSFYKGESASGSSFRLSDGISAVFRNNSDYLKGEIVSYRISDIEEGEFQMNGIISRTLSSYVPSAGDKDVKEHMKKVCNKNVCPAYAGCEVKNNQGSSLTFQCIALGDKEFAENKNGNIDVYGDDLLGVLKGDVDDLGKMMKRFSKSPDYTMSAMLQFSYQLDYFFSSVVPYKISRSGDIKHKLTYVLYSGGDDFILIGPWRSLLNLSFDMRKWFRDYTGGVLRFSAGLALFKPRAPLKWAVKSADDALFYAKQQAGKDKLCLYLGDEKFLINWGEYDSGLENLLVGAVKSGILSRSRINRFINLRNMAVRTKEKGKEKLALKNYLYVSYFRYIQNRDLRGKKGRNLEELEKVYNALMSYFASDVDAGNLKYLGMVLNISLIRTRRC